MYGWYLYEQATIKGHQRQSNAVALMPIIHPTSHAITQNASQRYTSNPLIHFHFFVVVDLRAECLRLVAADACLAKGASEPKA